MSALETGMGPAPRATPEVGLVSNIFSRRPVNCFFPLLHISLLKGSTVPASSVSYVSPLSPKTSMIPMCHVRSIHRGIVPITLISAIGVLLQCSLWTIIEPELAVIAANLSTLRPLFPSRNSLAYLTNRFSFSASSPTRKSWYGVSSGPPSNPAQNTVAHSVEYPLKGYREIRDPTLNGRTSRIERGSREIYEGPTDPGIHVREEISIV